MQNYKNKIKKIFGRMQEALTSHTSPLKSQKGITLIVLVVTLIIITIMTGTIYVRMNIGTDMKKYNRMCADVELLENKILIYYSEYGVLPITDEVTPPAGIVEEGTYYKIDISKLHNTTLYLGSGVDTDYYIVNTTSFRVYYIPGIDYDLRTYYTN